MPEDAWETVPAQPAPVAERPHRRRRVADPAAARRGGAAVALLAVGVAGGLLVDGGGESAPQGPTVALRAVDGAPASSSALARMTGGGHMLLTVRGLPPAKPGTYYEAWLMSDGKHLVPVASFTVDAAGEARIDVPLPASASDYRYIDVSLQHAAGGTEHSNALGAPRRPVLSPVAALRTPSDVKRFSWAPKVPAIELLCPRDPGTDRPVAPASVLERVTAAIPEKEETMDHAATMRRLYDLLSAGDIEGFGTSLADDFVEHEETPGLAPTKDGVLTFFRMYRAAFPTCAWTPRMSWPAVTRSSGG